ncbi:uncharacterized protein EAF02_007489 [Botrytis sinoallii]|uniref:uncharacterized protein n=1 Tax=Botrytis sinoallii TaxID=1463999 RepID=UPI0019014AB7|nr:uncharacterized protein EAF02_007489 [Botrytis sinoallii]KAF7880643.1 hypothetical protein EAF02_007489 [Botrytis sinoallii]
MKSNTSQVPELPGYYYDSEKKKYFKIQANAPSGSAYSSHDVKRRKLDDENNKAESLRVQRNVGRIKRAKILESPMAGGFLSREFGQPCLNTAAASYYAQSLSTAFAVDYYPQDNRASGAYLFDVSGCTNVSDPKVLMSYAANNTILHLSYDYGKKAKDKPRVPNVFGSHFRFQRSYNLGFPPGQSTSISANESIGHVVTTWSGVPASRAVVISPFPPPELRPHPMKSDIHLSPGTKRGLVDVLSSASAPTSSPDAFVIGTSKGILRINQNMDMSWIRTLNTKDQYYSDVFAVQYQSNHKDILLTGERRGILSLLDLRTSQSGSIAKIQHTSGIAEIKSLDEHRVLVAGCASDLCQYDRRFTKPNTHLSHTLKHTKNTTAPTTAYLNYPDYRNNGRLSIGLDVDLELGIIAAADDVSTTAIEARIKIFSLHGAQVLHEHTIPTDVPNMGCVKFVQDTFNEPKSIWATFAQKIVRLSLDDNHNIPSFKASTTWLSGS